MAEEKKASKGRLHPWWVVLVEGLALVVIGLLFLASPGKSMEVTVVMLGIYWTVDGVFIIASLVKDRSHWVSKLAIGIIDLSSVGFITQPAKWTVGFPALVLWLLGIGLIATGAIKLYHTFKDSGWGVGFLGVVSILFGIPLVLHPFVGDVILPPVLGIAGILGGIAAILMAFKERRDQTQAAA